MGRSRKFKAYGGIGASLSTSRPLVSPHVSRPLVSPYVSRPLSSYVSRHLVYESPSPLAYEPHDLPSVPSITPDPLLSPEAIIERYKPTCGQFTEPIPSIRSDLTWKRLSDLSTPQLTEAEVAGVTDPHELYRSLLGADGSLLKELRDALNDDDLLPVERTNEMQGLLSDWMDVRRGLGLPPILGLDGLEITVDKLKPLSCRLMIRSDLDEYSDTWRVVASFVQARADIFKAVFAEALIPSAIAGGYGDLAPCLEGFCHYALLKMRDAITTCFAREHRDLPTVTPMTGVLKMRRGRTTVSAFLETKGASVEGALTIEPYRDEIMGILQTIYPDVVWTDDDITTIFDELRMNRDAYVGGKTKRKRKSRRFRRKNT